MSELLSSKDDLTTAFRDFISRCGHAIYTNRDSGQVWVRREDLAVMREIIERLSVVETGVAQASDPARSLLSEWLFAFGSTNALSRETDGICKTCRGPVWTRPELEAIFLNAESLAHKTAPNRVDPKDAPVVFFGTDVPSK